MALTIGDNFSYQGAKPLDGRIKYDTVAAMKAMADSTLYDGCLAYCVATDKTYQWKSTNTVDTNTGKWREFETGGGSVDTSKLYSTDDAASTDLADADYVPFYDTSATAKKKTLWSNIKSVLKSYFDTLYSTTDTTYSEGDGISIDANNEISTDRMESSEIDDLDLVEAGQPSGMVIDLDGNELVIGTVIQNGVRKPLYQITVDCGSIPSGSVTERTIYTVSNADWLTIKNAYTTAHGIQLPYNNPSSSSSGIALYVWDNTLKLMTPSDRSSFGHIIATLQYTKTT